MPKSPFFLLATFALVMQQAPAAAAATDIYHVAIFRIPQEHLKDAVTAFRDMAVSARRERGAIEYNIYRGVDNPQVFYIVEHWASPEALAAHEHSQAFIRLGQGVLGKYATLHEAVTAQAFDVAKLTLPDQ